jgi:hypothetical protein
VGETLVPFHKLTQWLTYSLVVPLQQTLGWVIEGMEHLTGLPEYRNGKPDIFTLNTTVLTVYD